MPRNDSFFEYFEKQAAFIVRAAETLQKFEIPEHDSQEILETIKNLEQQGDKITQLCMEALHRTFITPFERTDIHRLISAMDDILDEIEDIARYLVLYKLQVLSPDAVQLTRLVVEATQEVQNGVKELRKMKNTKNMITHSKNISDIETKADQILSQAIGRLFDEEPDTRLIIKWKEVYEHLENATDVCDDVANILEGIILENE